ncbi:CPBP family intramembrane glutamic endopeptidase [Bacteroidota bacterium]
MNFLKNIFWNSEEVRLRAAYRITLQFILALGIMGGIFALLGELIPGVKFEAAAPWWVFFAMACVRFASGIGGVWPAGRFLDRRNFGDFGFHINKEWWIDFGFGLGLGAVLMTIIFFVQSGAGWVSVTDTFYVHNNYSNFVFPLAIVMLVFISVGFQEEITTRGYLLKNLAEGLNLKKINPNIAIIIAWISTSALFGYYHLGNPNATWISTINIALGGLFFGMAYVMTGELAIPIGLHISWNFFQGNVFGFPVSGLTIPRDVVTFIKIDQTGPEIWTGGAFGPEGGLIGLGAIILGTFITLFWLRIRRGKENIKIMTSLAVYKKRN